jgi:nucleoid DNA-binding protein
MTTSPVSKDPALTKRELIDAAVLRSGVKKKDAKPVVEALLAILGETVASGRDLNLKPFGKLHLNRSEKRSNGTVHKCRLRQPLERETREEESGNSTENSSAAPLASIKG